MRRRPRPERRGASDGEADEAPRVEAVGFGYLVLYNFMFVLPLIAILVVAPARPSLNRLAHWNLHHRERVGLGLGSAVVVMGFLILATV